MLSATHRRLAARGVHLALMAGMLALALFGGISLASRRYLPQREGGPLRVVGRTSLSPRQTVYLLRVGDRVLLVGAGPQGPPSLLGELTDPAELRRFAPRQGVPPAPDPV